MNVGVIGNYVKTFAQASHALPRMHMTADYPLMIPRITALAGGLVTLYGRESVSARVIRRRDGQEYCVVAQSSSYEVLFHKQPTPLRFFPFKDQDTPAIEPTQKQLFGNEPQ